MDSIVCGTLVLYQYPVARGDVTAWAEKLKDRIVMVHNDDEAPTYFIQLEDGIDQVTCIPLHYLMDREIKWGPIFPVEKRKLVIFGAVTERYIQKIADLRLAPIEI